MMDAGWYATTSWLGPPIRSNGVCDCRIWRWADGEAPSGRWLPTLPELLRVFAGVGDPLRDPPGFTEAGLAVHDETGAPVCALGRHPRLRRARDKKSGCIEQTVLASSDGGWAVVAVAEERPTRTVLRTASEAEVARINKPGRRHVLRRPGGDNDTVAADGRTWRLRALTVRSASSRRRTDPIGLALCDADGATPRAELVVSAGLLPLDVSTPFHLRWSSSPGTWELAASLVALAALIDFDHPSSRG